MRGLVLCGLDEILKDDVPIWGWAHAEKSQLSSYAYKGDMENLKRHITSENVDQRGLRGYSPLMWACTGNKIAAIQFLLNAGADVNHTDDVGATPLHVVSWYGRKPIVQALIEKGANVNVKTRSRDGRHNCHTPLHLACKGQVQAADVIKLLISSGADLNARNGMGETPLHLAVQQSNTKKAKILLKAGADINATDDLGYSPLNNVGSLNQIRQLLEFGADMDLENTRGEAPLLSFLSSPEILTLLLEYGAGARVVCTKKYCHCGKTVLLCCYDYVLHDSRWWEDSVDCFEKHFIRNKVCGIYLGWCNDPPAEHHDNIYWTQEERDEYRLVCEAEFALMSDGIGTFNVSYKDVLFQRPCALRERSLKKILTLEHCQEKFPEYGGLIHSRFVTGERKIRLVDRCRHFFDLTIPPLSQPDCSEQIFSYLSDEDLQVLSVVCETAKKKKKKRNHESSSKGSSSRSSQQSSKVLKMNSPGSSQQKTNTASSVSSAKGIKRLKEKSGCNQEGSKVLKKGDLVAFQDHSEKISFDSSGQDPNLVKRTFSVSLRPRSKVSGKGTGSSQQHSKEKHSDSSKRSAKLGTPPTFVCSKLRRSKRGRSDVITNA